MLIIGFFNHNNLVERETLSAFRRLPGVRVVIMDIVEVASPAQAEIAGGALVEHGVNVLFTINDWGLDPQGVLADYLAAKKILHVNWHVDDPFFSRIMHGLAYPPRPNRFDFVSDRGYVSQMRDKGYHAWFLPLATDPAIFHPMAEIAPIRDTCFVGNSYRMQLDSYVKDCEEFMEKLAPFMTRLLGRYAADMSFPVEAEIAGHLAGQILPGGLSEEKATFIIKHFVGYLFRKRVVLGLAERYPDFVAFGDEYWACDLEPKRVSRAVGYYTNLCQTYLQTRVNIDINRMVIRDGFTQRVFDCLGCGAFVITSPKKVVHEYFETHGDKRELVVFENEEHLRELMVYFLSHEEERRAIAERGRARVLALHTYDHRIRQIFTTLSKQFGRL